MAGETNDQSETPKPANQPSRLSSAEAIVRAELSGDMNVDQTSTLDFSGLTPDELKREFDIFRDVANNVNNTLRFQIQLSVTMLAACVTLLNIVPPQAHQEMLNFLDRWVFVPIVVSMVLGYRGLEYHWYSNTKHQRLPDIKSLYLMVKYKHKMIRWTLALQGFSLVLMMSFVLLEYK